MEVYNINFNDVVQSIFQNLNASQERIEDLENNMDNLMPKAGGTFTGAAIAAAPGANTFSTPQLINAIVLAKGSSPRTDLPAGTVQFILK